MAIWQLSCYVRVSQRVSEPLGGHFDYLIIVFPIPVLYVPVVLGINAESLETLIPSPLCLF